MAPIVSIIIPVFNRPVLVAEAIESVLAQTSPNWELIVVDDGSTDNTWEVLESYAAKDERIRVFKRDREPKGAPTCRNIGAGMARGEYLIFWDSDDLLFPWCVEERLKFMRENPNLDFGVFYLIEFSKVAYDFFLVPQDVEGDFLKRFIGFKSVWLTGSVIWLRNSYFLLGGWNEASLSWQDPVLHIKALLKGLKYKWGDPMANGLIRNFSDQDNITYNFNEYKKFENRLKVFGKIRKELPENYLSTFDSEVKRRIWNFVFFSNLYEISEIGRTAFSFGFLNEKEKRNFLFSSYFYLITKNIPIIRRPFYLKILKKSKNPRNYFPLACNKEIRENIYKRFKECKSEFSFSFEFLKKHNFMI